MATLASWPRNRRPRQAPEMRAVSGPAEAPTLNWALDESPGENPRVDESQHRCLRVFSNAQREIFVSDVFLLDGRVGYIPCRVRLGDETRSVGDISEARNFLTFLCSRRSHRQGQATCGQSFKYEGALAGSDFPSQSGASVRNKVTLVCGITRYCYAVL